jgi:hypothetical protein
MNIFIIIRSFTLCISMVSILGCSNSPNMHDNGADRTIPVWEQTVSNDSLKIHFLWAKPISKGHLPTIIVHPGILQKMKICEGY